MTDKVELVANITKDILLNLMAKGMLKDIKKPLATSEEALNSVGKQFDTLAKSINQTLTDIKG